LGPPLGTAEVYQEEARGDYRPSLEPPSGGEVAVDEYVGPEEEYEGEEEATSRPQYEA